MKTYRLNPESSRPPRGGLWHFNAEGVRFDAKTFADLVGHVHTHWAERLLTVAEVEQAVLQQTEVDCPWLVRQGGDAPSTPADQVVFREYVATLREVEFVEPDVASTRTAICRACPHNRPAVLDDAAQRRLFLLTRGQPDATLGLCALFHHHNAVACQLDTQLEPNQAAPHNCWKALTNTGKSLSCPDTSGDL